MLMMKPEIDPWNQNPYFICGVVSLTIGSLIWACMDFTLWRFGWRLREDGLFKITMHLKLSYKNWDPNWVNFDEQGTEVSCWPCFPKSFYLEIYLSLCYLLSTYLFILLSFPLTFVMTFPFIGFLFP